MDSDSMRSMLRITKALADRQRIRILMMLQPGELCVCQIVEVLGLAPSTTSKHLSILNAAGLVDMRKDGRWAYYRLPDRDRQAIAPILRWIAGNLRHDDEIHADAKKLRKVLATDPDQIARRQRARA